MPKASKATTPVKMDIPLAEDRACQLDGYTVDFVTIRVDHDLAPMLASLPGGMCHCPHWGVMIKGRVTVQYADREEVYEAGDAFYMAPGHTPSAVAGSELIQFSPTADQKAVNDAIMRNLAALQGA